MKALEMMDRLREAAPFIKAENEESKYLKLEDSDSDDDVHHRPQSQHRSLRWYFLALAASFLLGLITMALSSVIWNSALSTHEPPNRNIPEMREGTDNKTGLPLSWSHGDCGNSPDDALRLGCRFSIVLQAWLPADCLTDEDAEDDELMYEDRDWPYELANGTNLTIDELRTGQFHHFTTTFDWHVVHCMYIWKRVHRSMLDATRKLDSYTANFHHTNHCVKMIGGHADGMKDSGTKIFVKYPVCA